MTAVNKALNVLAVRDRYNSAFNTPRLSRHAITRRRFVPFNLIYQPLAGATLVNPWPPQHFDLLHAFNRVPLGPTPYVIGFESHLPRVFGREESRVAQALRRELASDRCRAIVPMSEIAKKIFLDQHKDAPELEALRAKIVVRFPNVIVPPDLTDWFDPAAPLNELRVMFVGGDFARKGGCVAVKVAERAKAAGAPIHFTIISSLNVGAKVYTDPSNPAFFEPYFKLLEQDNINFMRGAPNSEVLEIASKSHLQLLPTFADTFGYSAIEAMARFCPTLATKQGALPEFLNDENAVMLPLETDHLNGWVHNSSPLRAAPAFEKIFADEVERMADQTFAACLDLLNNPGKLAAMRAAGRRTVEQKFDARDAGKFWDDLYMKAVS